MIRNTAPNKNRCPRVEERFIGDWLPHAKNSSGWGGRRVRNGFRINPSRPETPLPNIQPWEYTGNVAHPTEKTVSVLRPLVESFAPAGGVVLDPFAGSGSTLVAAALAGRGYVGIELEEKYCYLAAAGSQASRASGGPPLEAALYR
ncbi:MAG TPA: DNA methyltransferase [Steroidobacteraceae bacterium]|nr:DNA methyltransferase [Steroidobacteraceae bacterium]